ncbi:MAG: hypothetical protein IT486_08585 [Gammaproteobacteria bacterium]|nr:hypothetical protein [Gammaproteobacteria bacterium]
MTTGFGTLATSLYGLRRSLDGLRREAQTVAHSGVDGATADLTGAAVRSAEQQRAAEANAAALRRASETLGSVIDIRV